MAIANLPKLNFSVPFAMTAALPVEYNAYFSTLSDATAAAATAEAPGSSTTVYYYGQKIVVVGETEAKLYIIQPDKTLKEAGGVPIGDGASITVGADGKIAINGFSAATDNQQPRVKVVDGVNTLEWYTPDTSTVEGLQQTVAQHTTDIDELQTRMTTAEDSINTNKTNIETNTSDITKITDGTTVVGKALRDAKNNIIDEVYATKTALTDGLATKANSADVYKKTETYSQTEVNDKIAAAVSSVYKPAGSSDFADLPTPAEGILGNVYNVNDAFTTDDKFVEGTGKKYPAGTNVVVVKVGDAYKYDVLSGVTDLTDYYTKEQTDAAIDADVKVVTDGLADGTIVPQKATIAISDDGNHVIKDWYAPLTAVQSLDEDITKITDGTTTVGKALKDGDGNIISDVYVTNRTLEDTVQTFVVNITGMGGSFSADKTFEEIKTANTQNKAIFAIRRIDNKVFTLKSAVTNSLFSFESIDTIETEISGTTYNIAHEILEITAAGGVAFATKDNEFFTADHVTDLVDGKVSKESGKGLSTNDFTTALKDKLTKIPEGAQVNAIDTVNEDEFTISDAKELGIKAVDKSKITGLQDALDTKLENVKLAGATDNLPINNKTVTLPGATASALGLVKGSTANNGVSINSDFTMTVNNITTDKLIQGTDTLIWNGGSAASAG